MSNESEQLTLVLAMAGVEPIAADLGPMATAYSIARENSALVASVAAARYEEPALIFSARP
ncbi:hypothetical protein [Kribbella sp.]|uniref:hypothetical protein n=1 Tax=Kribbella sp. TaxID=1871183 RepID=UPI002D3D8D71|nr:hypothetical protein [Kribbella sp.]HZX04752.1 hypothetical protein [Kribbella sp.]